MDSNAYIEAYNRLNSGQKLAVDTIEGPVMVVAGPGTGKTQILTLRIANILQKTDMRPENILALTFTESGAKAMRERLRSYIGAAAYQVPIFTFHGFAQRLIGDYPDAYSRVIGGRPINDLEKITLIESILSRNEVKLLRPLGNPTYYVAHILRMISQLKQEYITPVVFGEIIESQEKELLGIEKIHTKGAHKGKVRSEYTKKEQSIAKNRELLFVYRLYETILPEQKFYDFEDMIVETVKALSSDIEMLRDLQESYQYILADEHQDVNGSQNKILELLASFHDSPNIFAVGDEKQAIYRFQGASLQNFLYFTKQYKTAKVINLTENYRSGQSILDAAYSLMEVSEGPLSELRLPLNAVGDKESSLSLRSFSHQAVEDAWLLKEVAAVVEAGRPQNEIAVIVRTNREVEAMATLLRKGGFSVSASADGDILRHPITQAVMGLIDAVFTTKNEKALFTVLHGAYWAIPINDLIKIISSQSYEKNLWQIISNNENLEKIGVEDISAIEQVVTVITEARNKEVHEAPHRVLEFILQESGFLKHLLSHDPIEGVRVVRRLYDEIEAMVGRDGIGSLKEVSDAFAIRLDYGLPINAPYIVTNTETIKVMTAHKSKGLEFATVFVPHLNDSSWSGSNKKKYFTIPLSQTADTDLDNLIEDERRLLYVAMTRAKQDLCLSSAAANAEGRELIPARLIADIDEELLSVIATDELEKDFNPVESLSQKNNAQKIDKQLLVHLLKERGFSATSLNNYLSNPWDYFYRNVLRVPETQAPHMQFGTAVHNTLEYVTRHHTQKQQLPSEAEIKQKLEQELNRLPINTEEYVRLLEKGLEALLIYIPQMAVSLPKETKEEMKLRVLLRTGIPELPELLLTGKLDRIDLDQNGRALRVVDYKTGKPKSRNHIEGGTKDSDGSYKRQLVFYALLLSLYNDERYMCKEGVLSFVESGKKGELTEEVFSITDEEITELKEVIIVAAKEIVEGKFLTEESLIEKSEYKDMVLALLRRNQ